MRSSFFKITLGLMFLIIVLSGCDNGGESHETFKPENSAINMPHRVGYAYSNSNDSIAVLDLDSNEVVGIHHICRDKEFVTDFAIGPNGDLYFPVTSTGLATMFSGDTSGKIIRVMDTATGQMVREIDVAERPRRIYPLPGGKALVEHSYQAAGAESIACTLIDMNTDTAESVFYPGGIAGGVLQSSSGNIYINILDVLNQYGGFTLIEFDPKAVSLDGNPIVLETGYAEVASFVSDSHIYTQLISEDQESDTHVIGVMEFPSGRLLKKISIPGIPRTILVVGGKAYVTCFSGTPNNAAEDRALLVIDTETDAVVKNIPVCHGPQCITYSESTGFIYVGCVEGNICVVDTSTDEVVDTIRCEQLGGWGISQIRTAN